LLDPARLFVIGVLVVSHDYFWFGYLCEDSGITRTVLARHVRRLRFAGYVETRRGAFKPLWIRTTSLGHRTTPDVLRGDKAYSSRAHRRHLRSRGIKTVLLEPADQVGYRKNRGARGGRPVSYDVGDYKSRNVVERSFNHLKNWRGIATRYDKHSLVYRGGIVLAAITLWLRA